MAEASIPVDLLNPGQVFACLGFLEAADVLLGEARGGFDWSDEADVCFRLASATEGTQLNRCCGFLAKLRFNLEVPENLAWTRLRGTLRLCNTAVTRRFRFPRPQARPR